MSDSKTIALHIVNNNPDMAKEAFNSSLKSRIFELISAKKVEIGNSMFKESV